MSAVASFVDHRRLVAVRSRSVTDQRMAAPPSGGRRHRRPDRGGWPGRRARPDRQLRVAHLLIAASGHRFLYVLDAISGARAAMTGREAGHGINGAMRAKRR